MATYILHVETFSALLFNVVLRCTPERKSEHAVCGVLFISMIMQLMSNPLRLLRLIPEVADYVILGSSSNKWISNCSESLVESARDTRLVAIAITYFAVFNLFVRLRTKISFFIPIGLGIFGSLIFVRPFCVVDYSNRYWNYSILVLACAFIWYGSYYMERQHRLIWALRRQVG